MLRNNTHGLCLAMVLSMGCASGQSAARTEQSSLFPSRDALNQLASAHAPSLGKTFHPNTLEVEAWELAQPLPDTIGNTPVQHSPVSDLLLRMARPYAARVRVTEEMTCVARELARFIATQKAVPANNLKIFIMGRCGASVAELALEILETNEAKGDGNALPASWSEPMANAASRLWERDVPQVAGAYFVKEKNRAVLAMVAGDAMLNLNTVPMAPQGGIVNLEGELLTQAVSLRAVVNHGTMAVRECTPKPDVPLPRFAFACKTNPDDARAWIQILATLPDNVTVKPFVSLLARPSGYGLTTYLRPKQLLARAESVASEKMSTTLGNLINDLRKQQGLTPLAFSEKESDIATRLAPHYFASLFSQGDPSAATQVKMGLLAGWELPTLVRQASMTVSFARDTDDLGRLVSIALEMPEARAVLFDEKAQHLAIGVLDLKAQAGIGALLVTYRETPAMDTNELLSTIVDMLDEARKHAGKDPVELLTQLDDSALQINELLAEGSLEPEQAARKLFSIAKQQLRNKVTAWVMSAPTLDELVFPNELIDKQNIGIAPIAAIVRLPGQAWVSYVVIMIGAAPEAPSNPSSNTKSER